MPIVRLSLLGAASLLAVAAIAQVNPLAGDTKAPVAFTTDAFGGLIIPAASRGKLEPDPATAATGGVAFADDAGWYRFTMADGGTTTVDGDLRLFNFPAGTIPTTCFALRVPDKGFAEFGITQIQAELETLYAPFDEVVSAAGFTIETRNSVTLDATGQRSATPLKLLGWDARGPSGQRMTWTLMPSPVGQLVFACSGADPGHHREVIQRYLRIGAEMTSGPK